MSPPKFPSIGHWPASASVQRDDTYYSQPEFFVGREVVITEKLDGGNTCLFRGEVYGRSVATPSHAGWMAMVRKHHAWKTRAQPAVYYGEDLYGVHSIEYAPLHEEQTFRLFAVRVDDRFLSQDEVAAEAVRLGLPSVPELFRGRFASLPEITAWFRAHIGLPSPLGPTREGFVLRVAEGFAAADFARSVCKFVRPNHVQSDRHWTRDWRPCALRSDPG